jgi:predicted amino acid-binding ACT domain protein
MVGQLSANTNGPDNPAESDRTSTSLVETTGYMLVLDFVRQTAADQPSILLPRIHSGPLGFVPGTRVHVAIPTATPIFSSRSPEARTEVIVTPFHTTTANTALVSVVLHDAIGVVRSLVQALSHLNINIEVQESSSIDHLDLHRVGMIVDLGGELEEEETPQRVQEMYRPYAANVPIHSRRYLQLFDMIVARCGDALWWHKYEGRLIPALYVRPLTRRDELNPSSVVLESSADRRYTEIKIPDDIADHIRGQLDVGPDASRMLSYLFVADTNDRTLRTFFVPNGERLVHVGFYHRDRAGTLARILEVLAAAEFNIFTSLLRKHSKTTSVWEVVLEYRGSGAPPSKPTDRKRLPAWYRETLLPWLNAKLRASPEISQIDGCHVEIGPPRYPLRYGGEDNANRMALSRRRKRTEDSPRPTNSEIISMVEQRQSDIEGVNRSRPEVRSAKSLLMAVETHRERIRQRTLFLSYPSSGSSLVDDYLRSVLEPPRKPFYHLTQFQESRPPDIQTQIIQLIRDADYFLAVWHPDDDETRHRIIPTRLSPWMFFEYGIARALNKPLVVACHEDLHAVDPRRLVGNHGLIMYTDANFASEKVPLIAKTCVGIFNDQDEALFDDESRTVP